MWSVWSEIVFWSGGVVLYSLMLCLCCVVLCVCVVMCIVCVMVFMMLVVRVCDVCVSVDCVVGLVGGFCVVVDVLCEYVVDGFVMNVVYVCEDVMYVVFFVVSVIGFGMVVSGEMMSLWRRRDRARAAFKECATMLDLKSKEMSGVVVMVVVGWKMCDVGWGKWMCEIGVGKDFWNELGYLLKVAFFTVGSRGG